MIGTSANGFVTIAELVPRVLRRLNLWPEESDPPPIRAPRNQAHDEQDEKDEEQDLRDSRCGDVDARETENSRDERNQQEYQCPVQHEMSPSKRMPDAKNSSAAASALRRTAPRFEYPGKNAGGVPEQKIPQRIRISQRWRDLESILG